MMIKIPHSLYCQPLILLAINAYKKARRSGGGEGRAGQEINQGNGIFSIYS